MKDKVKTAAVLMDIAAERVRQRERYGSNADLEDGTGPKTAWLLPLAPESAEAIEKVFRQDYEDYEEEVGKVTWVHLIREEIAEAFKETDPVKLREELVQVAALAVSWIEKIDDRLLRLLGAVESYGDQHDLFCEAEYIHEAGGWTDCGCLERSVRLNS